MVEIKKKLEFGMKSCIFCGDSWRYDFERELESKKPEYIMSVWYNKKSLIEKITKKKNNSRILGRENKRKYICIDCALNVNESLMRHLKNFKMQKMKFEDEKYK